MCKALCARPAPAAPNGPLRARPASGWASLTQAERRVAHPRGEGHTNKSAASALGVCINTVGTHLRAVFAKLACNPTCNWLTTSQVTPAKCPSTRCDGRPYLSVSAAGEYWLSVDTPRGGTYE